MTTLSKIAQIAVQATDLPRAIAFYRDTLGLPLMFEVSGMAFFDAGGVRLLVGPMFKKEPPSGDVFVYFDSGDDWHATEQALESRGVAFAPRTESFSAPKARNTRYGCSRIPMGTSSPSWAGERPPKDCVSDATVQTN